MRAFQDNEEYHESSLPFPSFQDFSIQRVGMCWKRWNVDPDALTVPLALSLSWFLDSQPRTSDLRRGAMFGK